MNEYQSLTYKITCLYPIKKLNCSFNNQIGKQTIRKVLTQSTGNNHHLFHLKLKIKKDII